ncbi:hypothetical protein HS7_07550 [Sulfolobales archaeon HS-7]|nr:hypothetical protein HS7_07550 [Sulfolobales archaeon HS-7]
MSEETENIYINNIDELFKDKRYRDVFEILYLLFKSKLNIIMKGKKSEFQEIILSLYRRDITLWKKFIVYVDLREKGRVLEDGPFESSLLLLTSKEGEPYAVIYIVSENEEIYPSKIFEILRFSRKNSKELFLAIIDKYGDITYYNLSESNVF